THSRVHARVLAAAVGGWSERSFPRDRIRCAEDPTLGFLVVITRTHEPEVLERRRSAPGVVLMVITFEIPAVVTALHTTLAATHDQRGHHLGRHMPPQNARPS